MKVLIVESPTKVKTISKYVGSDTTVLASFGHVRDLSAHDGSVDPTNDFSMVWELSERGEKQMSAIAKAVKKADEIILATDPDREGEAIAWHVTEVLSQKKALGKAKISRATFNAVTKDAVKAALAHPRDIDPSLVQAYLARRALDYLVGFTLSPLLWRKLPVARSAGRVQSVALRLVCDRESEIESFKNQDYWSLVAQLLTPKDRPFTARLVGADGKKLARLDIDSESKAKDFKAGLEGASFRVDDVEAKPVRRQPQAPFTTSTLQQEASRKYGFSPAKTMQLAQKLYEGLPINGETVGLITYMRTDGVDMAPEAVTAIRTAIDSSFGKDYIPSKPRKYATKAKTAQEAHEAIRPTDVKRTPAIVSPQLDDDLAKLYSLIWNRTVASQMSEAKFERTTVTITAQNGTRIFNLRATGQVQIFDGFLRLYQENLDDETSDDDEALLPAMRAGDLLTRQGIEMSQHTTEPPPRFTEASLIKRLEELGIGRPSTYQAILSVLHERGYVRQEKKRLVPECSGRLLSAFLKTFFLKYVEYDFTAQLEETLDRIAQQDVLWKEVLSEFWNGFNATIESAKGLRMTQVIDTLNTLLDSYLFPPTMDKDGNVQTSSRQCPSCDSGTLSLKMSRFGAFIGCSNYPTCTYTRQLSAAPSQGTRSAVPQSEAITLGTDPQTGESITVRDGRFGPYVQRGEESPTTEKPKRQSLPQGVTPETITLDHALSLLALPRPVATHPRTHEPILVGLGRFGPYVQHGKTYANLTLTDDIFHITGERAIELIQAKEAGKLAYGKSAAPELVLGIEPETKKTITLKSGRYGPYVTDGITNASLPRSLGKDVSLEAACALLAAKRSEPEKPGASPSLKRATAKKTPSRKNMSSKTKTKAVDS
jgi:DNA topoisomerase-1